MKKIFMVLAVVTVIFSLMSFSSFAADETTSYIEVPNDKGYLVKAGKYEFAEKLDFSMLDKNQKYVLKFNFKSYTSATNFYSFNYLYVEYLDAGFVTYFYTLPDLGSYDLKNCYYADDKWVSSYNRTMEISQDFYIDDLDFVEFFLKNTTCIDGEETPFFMYHFFAGIGNGLRNFLPSVASASVSTVDALFVNDAGKSTIVAMLSVLGFVMWGGRKVISVVKRKKI